MTIFNIDFAYEGHGMDFTVHGINAMALLGEITRRGEPVLFSAKYPTDIGEEIIFNRIKARGRIMRLISREEFEAWEGRLFPGKASAVGPEDLYFFEVSVD